MKKFLLDHGEIRPTHLYQRALYKYVKDTPKCCIWVDMGLGKTRPVAAAVCDFINAFDGVDRVLVIGPKRVVEEAWPEQLQEWKYTRHLRFQTLTGGRAGVHKMLDNPDIDIDLVSYEMAAHVISKMGLPYDVVVIDESQYIANPSSKRHIACELLVAEAERVIQLTGTPSPNGLHQIWAQIKLIDGGKRLGRSQKAFLRRWFDVDPHSGKPKVRPGAEEIIRNKIRDVCFTLLSEDYENLPPLVVNDVKVNLTPKEMKRYNKFERDSVLEMFGDVETITATSVSALYAKLTQFANGCIYDEDKNAHDVHDHKLEALDEILLDSDGENVLVMYTHVSDRERIMKRHKHARWLKTTDDVRAWKRGEIELALAHPSSIAVGLNMQSGGRIMVWYGMIWNLGNYLQCIKRLWRQGQTKPVIMHRILCDNTIDNVIVRALKYKGKKQYNLMSAMKHRIEDVLGKKLTFIKKKAA